MKLKTKRNIYFFHVMTAFKLLSQNDDNLKIKKTFKEDFIDLQSCKTHPEPGFPHIPPNRK